MKKLRAQHFPPYEDKGQLTLADGLDNLELNIVRRAGVSDSTILEEQVFRLLILEGVSSEV